MTCAELDKMASMAETEADLLRQASGVLRSGDVAGMAELMAQVGRLSRESSLDLVNALMISLKDRDPELWRRAEHDQLDRGVAQLPRDKLAAAALLHAMVCRDPECPTARAIYDRMR